MKRSFIFPAVALLAMSVCSCSKNGDDAAAPQGVRVSFWGDCTQPTDAAKTSRASVDPATGKTSWTAGDRCGVWVAGNSENNVPFTNTQDQPDLFSGTLDAGIASSEPVWAYYPYSTDAACVSGTRSMTIPLPATQVQQGDLMGGHSIMTASGTLTQDAEGNPKITSMHFIHRTAGICFNVYGSLRSASPNHEVLQSVSITTRGAIASKITVTDPADPAATITFSGSTTMTVTVENAANTIGYAKTEGSKAFLSVLCGNPYQITSITVRTDQAVYTKSFTALPEGYRQIDPVAGNIYPINLNLNTFTAVENHSLGVPGMHNGWNAAEGITGRTAGFFSGMVPFAGSYKYNLNGTWYGFGGEMVTLYYTLSTPGSDFSITGSYYAVVDLVGNNASLIDSITLPGSANGWDPAEAPAFTYDADRDLWTISGVSFTTGEEFKVVFNKTWLANMNRTIVGGGTILPGTPVHLGFDAANNIVVGQGGTYDVTLDLSTYGGTLLLEPTAGQ